MTYHLGNLSFGGRVVFETAFDFTVELPCGLFIRVPR